MAVVDPSTFERLLTGLDGQTFTAFVADLWTARGADAHVEGANRVVIDADGREKRVIRTVHWRSRVSLRIRLATGDIDLDQTDVLVTNRDHLRLERLATAAGSGYVGPDRLREVLLYGIDRERSADLFQAYFDRSITGAERSDSDGRPAGGLAARFRSFDSGGWNLDGPGRRTTAGIVVGLAICAILVAGFGGAPLLEPSIVDSPGSAVDNAGPVEGGGYPRAVAAAADGRLGPLLDRHRAVLRDRSFVLAVTHNRTRGTLVADERWQWATQRIHVGPTRTVVDVSGALVPTTIGASPRPVAFEVAWNASSCTTRGRWNATRFGDSGPCPVLSNRSGRVTAGTATATYVRRYLEGTDPTIRQLGPDAAGKYRLQSTRPPPDIADATRWYRAVATVDSRGLISELRVTYETPVVRTDEPVEFTYTVQNLSTTSG